MSETRTLFLSRTWTLRGRHIGPGRVTEGTKKTDKTFLEDEYDVLVNAEERLDGIRVAPQTPSLSGPETEEIEVPKKKLEDMKRDELRAEGEKRGIPGAKNMGRSQLLNLLVDSE